MLFDADLHHLINERDLEMQTGHGRGVVFPEPQDDGLLVRFDGIARVRKHPDRQEKSDNPGKQRQKTLPLIQRRRMLAPPAIFVEWLHAWRLSRLKEEPEAETLPGCSPARRGPGTKKFP